MVWPAAGFADTQFGCFMKQDVATSPKNPRCRLPDPSDDLAIKRAEKTARAALQGMSARSPAKRYGYCKHAYVALQSVLCVKFAHPAQRGYKRNVTDLEIIAYVRTNRRHSPLEWAKNGSSTRVSRQLLVVVTDNADCKRFREMLHHGSFDMEFGAGPVSSC